MITEVWKDIKSFEGLYQISSLGRLKSFKTLKEGYVLSNKNSKNGYFSVVLKNSNTRRMRYTRIHRLVAEAFIPNTENKPQINHIDCNKQNNHINNLEWVTGRENIAHAIKHNPNILKGMNDYNQLIRPKTIQQYSLDGEFINEFCNSIEAGNYTGVCSRNILQVAGKDEYKPHLVRKQAGGFVWKFKDGGRE